MIFFSGGFHYLPATIRPPRQARLAECLKLCPELNAYDAGIARGMDPVPGCRCGLRVFLGFSLGTENRELRTAPNQEKHFDQPRRSPTIAGSIVDTSSRATCVEFDLSQLRLLEAGRGEA
jgi:hypothetical protein